MIDLTMLEKLRRFPDGGAVARCPACGEAGNDASGNHLRVFPDGRFGCAAHPGDKPHRKRVFELVGIKPERAPIVVRRPRTPSTVPIVADVFALIAKNTTVGGGSTRTDGTDASFQLEPEPMTAGQSYAGRDGRVFLSQIRIEHSDSHKYNESPHIENDSQTKWTGSTPSVPSAHFRDIGSPSSFPMMDGSDPHQVGWSPRGEPIYHGTQRQFEDAIDLAVIAKTGAPARSRTAGLVTAG